MAIDFTFYGLSFYPFPREENLKQQWLIKIKCRNIQLTQHARMGHAYCFSLIKSWLETDAISAGPK